MDTTLLTFIVLGLTALVVTALFFLLWGARTSARNARIALVSGGMLSVWAVVATTLAYRGVFEPQAVESFPPVGVNLVVVLSVLFLGLATSVSLRRLLTRQSDLIRLHVWRLVGIVFLLLMVRGQVPALWALPAGVGDILIGVTAPWVASDVETRHGRRRAMIWNLFGMVDLIVAVGLGVMTSPGPTQVFQIAPTSELMAHFPLALVPTFLVPLAFVLHVTSLWQLLGGTWAPHPAATLAPSR
jgi:hypothetical protein